MVRSFIVGSWKFPVGEILWNAKTKCKKSRNIPQVNDPIVKAWTFNLHCTAVLQRTARATSQCQTQQALCPLCPYSDSLADFWGMRKTYTVLVTWVLMLWLIGVYLNNISLVTSADTEKSIITLLKRENHWVIIVGKYVHKISNTSIEVLLFCNFCLNNH